MSEIRLRWTKIKQFLTAHQVSVYIKFEYDSAMSCPNYGRKPPETAILSHFWPLESENWTNVAEKRIKFERLWNKCIH